MMDSSLFIGANGKRRATQVALSASFVLAVATAGRDAGAETLTASTSVTVVTVDYWHPSKSPPEAEFYDVDVELTNVQYSYDSICWDWTPRDWPTGSTDLNGLIWKLFSENGGRTFTAQAWDWIGPWHECKARSAPVPDYWIGMMVSTLCGLTDKCSATGRSNIDFQNPADPNY